MNGLDTYAADITSARTSLKFEAGGTPPQALVTTTRPEAAVWRHAIDEMLRWMSSSSNLDPDDAPEMDILATAIDYAVDQTEDVDGDAAPASIVPSGGGRIAMEWNDGPVTVIVEFVGRGVANYSEFRSGKLIRQSVLVRNPKSRQMELRG